MVLALSGDDVPGHSPDPSEDAPEGVVPANDESAHPTRQRVEAVGVEVLQALAASIPRRRLLGRVPAALVPAPVGLPPEAQGDAEPEAGAEENKKRTPNTKQ